MRQKCARKSESRPPRPGGCSPFIRSVEGGAAVRLVGRSGEVVTVFGGEERRDESSMLSGAFEEEEVSTAADDLQPGIWDDTGEDTPVDHGNDGVVVTDEHEGGLPQPPQPRQAGPEADRV